MSIEAMKQWLSAIERANALDGMYSWQDEEDSLRQSIAEAEKQEPVAWMYVNEDGECEDIGYGKTYLSHLEGCTPLYTHQHPAQTKA